MKNFSLIGWIFGIPIIIRNSDIENFDRFKARSYLLYPFVAFGFYWIFTMLWNDHIPSVAIEKSLAVIGITISLLWAHLIRISVIHLIQTFIDDLLNEYVQHQQSTSNQSYYINMNFQIGDSEFDSMLSAVLQDLNVFQYNVTIAEMEDMIALDNKIYAALELMKDNMKCEQDNINFWKVYRIWDSIHKQLKAKEEL